MKMRSCCLLLVAASLLLVLSGAAEAAIIVLDNDPVAGPGSQDGTVTLAGGWQASTSNPLHWDQNYHHDQNSTGRLATYTPNLPFAGDWTVEAWWTAGSNRAAAAPYTLNYDGGFLTIPVDQQVAGGMWNTLGTYSFQAGTGGSVEIASAPSGYVIADAVRFTAPDPILPGEPIETTLQALDDAHVRGGSNANNNYGTLDYIQLKRGNDSTNSRKAYMKFATDDSIPGFAELTALTDAEVLLPFILGAGNAPAADAEAVFRVYGILDDSWDQGSITWNNAPENDTGSLFLMEPGAQFLGTFSTFGTAAGDLISFSSPELVAFIQGGGVDGLLTLAITRDTPESLLGANYVHTLSSSEYSGVPAGPMLHLTGVSLIPEPGTLCLLGLGGLLLRRRRRA